MCPSIEQALWYSERARSQLRDAENYFRHFRYPQCVSCAQDCIEFSLKAIFEFLGETYPRVHELSRRLNILVRRLPQYRIEISRAIAISDRWIGRARNLSRYGEQIAGVPATRIFGKNEAEAAKRDATEIIDLLFRIEVKEKFKLPIKVGILNGYVEGPDENEIPCSEYPYTNFSNSQLGGFPFSH